MKNKAIDHNKSMQSAMREIVATLELIRIAVQRESLPDLEPVLTRLINLGDEVETHLDRQDTVLSRLPEAI